MKRSSTRRRDRQGFTLMEMLVVLAILVLLMALVAPKILGTQAKADIKATVTQIGLLKGALQRYHLEMRGFPTNEQGGLQALMSAPGATAEGAVTGWDGPYLEATELPKDPWGTPYGYEYPPTRGMGKFPDIWSFGPDRQDNTEDDITSWGTSTQGAPGEGDLEGDGFEDFEDFEDFSDPGMGDPGLGDPGMGMDEFNDDFSFPEPSL